MTSVTTSQRSRSSSIVFEPVQPDSPAMRPAEVARTEGGKGNGRQVAQPTAGASPHVANAYALRNAPACDAYFAAHPQVADFLQASYGQLRRFFGPEASLVLEVVRDPEASVPSDFLFVNIRTSMPVDDALARLDQFDEDWYLDQVDTFGDLVNFNLEFYEL
jgi:hypothetical protein